MKKPLFTLRHGLRYGWWKDAEVLLTLAGAVIATLVGIVGGYLFSAWIFGL